MIANETQVGGGHYRSKIQHWDYVVANDLGYFEGQITKYVTRWRKKNGLQDLLKARHFLDKLIELQAPPPEPEMGPMDDDQRQRLFDHKRDQEAYRLMEGCK